MNSSETKIDETVRILGLPVSLVNMETAVAKIMEWTRARTAAFVCVRDVHGVMLAQTDKQFMAIHENAGMVTADGMPLVWLGKYRTASKIGRVSGSDLVDAVCFASTDFGLRHYFYGGKPGVAEKMASLLKEKYPKLIVAGCCCPPFRPMGSEEDSSMVRTIVTAEPQIVWVGLSTPKQEYWMQEHVGRIPGATLIGVGAAFDFQAGEIKRAPIWMQRSGLEWLQRLCSEPRRLWRRYLLLAPKFILFIILEELSRLRRT